MITDRLVDDHDDMRKVTDNVLRDAGLTIGDSGGEVTFAGKEPVRKTVIKAGATTACVLAANAVADAAIWKERTGEGQSIEVPMFETMVDAVLSDHAGGQMFDPPIGPAGYPRSLAPERHPYKTKDSYVCVMVYTNRHWRSFFELVGSDLADTDPRFESLTTRTVHAREIHMILRDFLLARTTDEWLSAFESADIPATPLHTLESLVDDPHLEAIGFFEWIEHPSEGRLRTMRPASKWSATPQSVRSHAPLIGEHTRAILSEYGYSESAIQAMLDSGAAAAPP